MDSYKSILMNVIDLVEEATHKEYDEEPHIVRMVDFLVHLLKQCTSYESDEICDKEFCETECRIRYELDKVMRKMSYEP